MPICRRPHILYGAEVAKSAPLVASFHDQGDTFASSPLVAVTKRLSGV
jgi:hypothetical protein